MSEMEVIGLQTGCKGGVPGVWDSLVGRGSRKTEKADQSLTYFDTRGLCWAKTRAEPLLWYGSSRPEPAIDNGSAGSRRSDIAASSKPAASRKPVRVSRASPHQISRFTLYPTFLKP